MTVFGLDISPGMVAIARSSNPDLDFQVGDMRHLDLSDGCLVGVVLFYAIVHCDVAELTPLFQEARRVLGPGGPALVSFHVGDQVLHVEDLFGARVSLDFRFHVPDGVAGALRSANSRSSSGSSGCRTREPRCYLVARVV